VGKRGGKKRPESVDVERVAIGVNTEGQIRGRLVRTHKGIVWGKNGYPGCNELRKRHLAEARGEGKTAFRIGNQRVCSPAKQLNVESNGMVERKSARKVPKQTTKKDKCLASPTVRDQSDQRKKFSQTQAGARNGFEKPD